LFLKKRGKLSVVESLKCSLTLSDIATDMLTQSLRLGTRVVVSGTGTSMEPTISAGDRLELGVPDALSVGDIVLVQMQPDVFVVHRIIRIRHTKAGALVVTKGDNLSQPDHPIPESHIIGKVVAISHSPKCG
jgi:signal peptidase I